MTKNPLIPSINSDITLSKYMEQIKEFPMLEADEEFSLARDLKNNENIKSAHKLVTSHLRLVAKIAMGYRGYGLPVSDLISEGNIGLMHAVKKFDPDKGFRLATYAMWWIKASIQEYILRSWSLVKIGTTAAQKKLFFNLRRIKGKIGAIDNNDLEESQINKIVDELDVPRNEVISMNQRLSGNDKSLNTPIGSDNYEQSGEWQDWIEDTNANQEVKFLENQEFNVRHNLLIDEMKSLNEREMKIFQARRLSDPPLTLEQLANEFNVSRERIRQIEVRAFEKISKSIKEKAIKLDYISN